MIQKILFSSLTCLFFTVGIYSQSSTDPLSKIHTTLLQQIEEEGESDLIVVFKDQADVSEAYNIKGKKAKGGFVFQKLRRQALESQGPALEILRRSGRNYDAFYIVNAIRVKADRELMLALTALPEVDHLQPNPGIQLDLPLEEAPGRLNFRNAIEWGIRKIRADQAWEMGYLGQGVVIGGQDTGYEWDHPTIKEQYRGWNEGEVDHNYNWHDAIREVSLLHGDTARTAADNDCGLDVDLPCDDHNHGTHTMGTMVGDDGQGNQIGVAPQARWIGCRNMEAGYGSPATYIECFEWFLAPTNLEGESPNPDLAPHVINNSWSCPEMEGCTPENWDLMQTVIANLRAAGIVVVVSAGNSGRAGCGTVNAPAAMYDESFSIGAIASNDTIAAFSSRGPVLIDASGRMKPDIVAPGVSVRSAVRGDQYAWYSGTSMAGPHVAGAVALIISANPGLAGEVDRIETIIKESAIPRIAEESCGDIPGTSIPNNTYGYGSIDVLSAIQKALLSSEDSKDLTAQSVWVFPNPARERLHLRLVQWEGDADVMIYNSLGQLVQSYEWENPAAEVQTVDLQDLAAGLYFYQLVGNRQKVSGEFVKR
jgi:serine protease AprX